MGKVVLLSGMKLEAFVELMKEWRKRQLEKEKEELKRELELDEVES